MAQTLQLNAQPRTGETGTRVARRLRKAGLVPAVVYGHKEATIAVTVKADELTKAIRHGVRVVDLKVDGKAPEKALIREVQWDHLGKDVLHVDFARVAADEKITIEVRVELRGIAPGVAGRRRARSSRCTACTSSAWPSNIPEIDPRQHRRVADSTRRSTCKELKLPEGVTVEERSRRDRRAGGAADRWKRAAPRRGRPPNRPSRRSSASKAEEEGEEEAKDKK